MLKRSLLWLWLLLVISMTAVWAAPAIPPKPTADIYVQDYAGVLSSTTKSQIQATGSKLAAATTAQVAVVTVKSLDGAVLEDYSLSILRQWGIGDQQRNNGVLLLVAIDDRQSRIEVGYGLEGRLTDAKTGRIQDQYLLPHARAGDYDQAILTTYLALVNEVAQEYKQTDFEPPPTPGQHDTGWRDLLIAVGVVGLLIIDWLLFDGQITRILLFLLMRGGRGGGSGGGGFGGGSGGGGGSSRRW